MNPMNFIFAGASIMLVVSIAFIIIFSYINRDRTEKIIYNLK